MSKVNTTILQDIESIIDDIESILLSFQSNELAEEDKSRNIENIKTSSFIQNSINRTNSLYVLVQLAGSFPVSNHSINTTDAMSKWALIIDNLHWSMFGYEYNTKILENNKMRIILCKLKHIKNSLHDYIPTRC